VSAIARRTLPSRPWRFLPTSARPPWRDDVGPGWSSTKVAQLGYDGADWTLYGSDSSGRWWAYDEAAPARDLAPLLAAIDEDVTGIFCG
jgi:hypothetical protein